VRNPFDLVLLDVNGTLVPSRPARPPSRDEVDRLAVALAPVRDAGIAVGLCSDSPLERLRDFGHHIGRGAPGTFPVVAENGNVVDLGTPRVTAPFPWRTAVRSLVTRLARERGLVRGADVSAPEFGGRPVEDGAWAFGADRRASVSVFGPRDLVAEAGPYLTGWARDNAVEMSVDCAPRNGFVGVHPYAPTTTGKRRALGVLAREGHRPLMVGDSAADWAPPASGVRCAFVGGTTVPARILAQAWYVSGRPEIDGVIDILRRVAAAGDAQ
jgi:hypothetical protein